MKLTISLVKTLTLIQLVIHKFGTNCLELSKFDRNYAVSNLCCSEQPMIYLLLQTLSRQGLNILKRNIKGY